MPGGSHDGYPLYGNTRGCDSVSEHGSGDDAAQALQAIEQREVALAGAEDATFPVAETRAMADSIPNASFAVLDGVAHLAALEDPARVNRLLDEFLFEVDQP